MMLSCSLRSSVGEGTYILDDQYQCTFFEKVDDVLEVYSALSVENKFLSQPFLKALEQAPPSGTSFWYGIVKESDSIVGMVYFQLKKIDLADSLRLDQKSPKGLWNKAIHQVKLFGANLFNANLLVCGNMTLTGNNGYHFTDQIPVNEHLNLAYAAGMQLVCHLKKQNVSTAVLLMKDFFSHRKEVLVNLPKATRFAVQPNMVMDIPEAWNDFNDYLSAMRSKYRVRVRRAKKKAGELEKVVLSLEEIHAYGSRMHELYKNVAEQAGFNLFILPENYFYSLQKHLGEQMKTCGYFRNGRLVGFSTAIKNNGETDAHFLGYEPKCNHDCQLYLNMLYDLVEESISNGSEKLIMSRTAMEIKSSVGAEGIEMHLFIRSINPIMNYLTSRLLKFFKPDTSWIERSPFK